MLNLPTLADKKHCTGCLACVDACQKSKALTQNIADDGHIYPSLDESKCIGCKLCEKACPVINNFEYTSNDNAFFFAAWNTNPEQRKKSASGGAFAAMATYIIKQGGVVIGASQRENCDVRHILIDRIEDIELLQGSKYTQSSAIGIYFETLKKLKEGGIVLFSGTGCQVAGLYSYLSKKKYTGQLITVDLICGGVPSKLLIDCFRKNEPFVTDTILSYRTKESGWSPNEFEYNLKVIDSNKIIRDYTGKRDIITKGFAMELTNRWSCYDCKFAGINRLSDFTIGDFWGIEKYNEQYFNGISLIISHNKKADNLLKMMSVYLESNPVLINEAIRHNYRLYSGKSNGVHTIERKLMTWAFNHLSYKNLKKIYAYENPGVLYKVYFHLSRLIINSLYSESKNKNK